MNKVLKELLSTALYILFILFVTYIVITYVGQRTLVEGTSMMNTLSDGDNLWVDKLSYRFKDPERFDIVVFPPRSDLSTHYIKRIIGLPGETVRIDEEGYIYINGEILDESFGREVIREDMRGRAENDVILGPDEYFVMGDNRNESLDSRFDIVGNIKRNELTGKGAFRIWPLNKWGKVN
ncbi:MAG: signal peptidase I [Acetatifactor sp.]|nr:signal peptidase I [Acetatifactor sp.]